MFIYTKCLFLHKSKLDHTICPDLFLVLEARKYESTSFSALKDRSQLCNRYCYRQQLFAKQFEECQEDFRTWSFSVARLETSILQSRIFSYNCLTSTYELYTVPKLSHIDFSYSQSGP